MNRQYLVLLLLLLFGCNTWAVSGLQLTVRLLGVDSQYSAWLSKNLSITDVEATNNLDTEKLNSLYVLGSEELFALLQTKGYYKSNIAAKKVCKQNFCTIEYDIKLGQRTVINNVTIAVSGEGKDNKEIAKALHAAPKDGDYFEHAIYEDFKHSLLSAALHQGYLDAHFIKHEVIVTANKLNAHINITFDTKQRYYIGDVFFKEPPYDAAILKQYIPTKYGAPYTIDEIIHIQKILSDTNLFIKVRIDPILGDSVNKNIPLQIRLVAKPHNKYLARAGYGTDTGLRATFGYERLRLSHPGHKIITEAKMSLIRKSFNAAYVMPGINKINDKIIFNMQGIEEKLKQNQYSRKFDVGSSYIRIKEKFEHLYSLHFLTETFRERFANNKQHAHLLLPTYGLTWQNYNKDLPLPSGYNLGFIVRGGLKTLLSSTSVLQNELKGGAKLPITDTLRLNLKANFGVTKAKNFNEVPLSLRFFTGGDNTVRGYAYKSIGPTGGGRYLMVNSCEIEQLVYQHISAAVFMDAGNAMNKLSYKLKKAVGVGMRYNTPLGPFRFDIARPTNDKKNKFRIHVNFGMDI